MLRERAASGECYAEVLVRLSGSVLDADEAFGAEVTEADVEDLAIIDRTMGEINLLNGVDRTNPEVRKLFENILEALREDVDYALREGAER